MSGQSSIASEQALLMNKQLARGYYGIALPALQERNAALTAGIAGAEPGFMSQAYAGQRTGLTEGLTMQGDQAEQARLAGAKKMMSGGNFLSAMSPADIGAQLANALYGSKFQESQANIEQMMNAINMGLGGSGQAGNAALTASGNQLNAIGYLPKYNTTYANIVGGAAGLASIYGAGQQAGWFTPGLTPGAPVTSPGTSSGWTNPATGTSGIG